MKKIIQVLAVILALVAGFQSMKSYPADAGNDYISDIEKSKVRPIVVCGEPGI